MEYHQLRLKRKVNKLKNRNKTPIETWFPHLGPIKKIKTLVIYGLENRPKNF